MSDLGPQEPRGEDLGGSERPDDPTVALLRDERPRPSDAFRGELRRRLSGDGDDDRRQFGLSVPLGTQIVSCLGAGVLLLVIALLGLLGAGPFAA
ncbi:MAG TPA: hypothetical protein VHZ54_13845 [Solirubrobacterales bacterium]|jgi:hypothetical protein|nr:hypothetical protein [Solirubrobacterales bacterium]